MTTPWINQYIPLVKSKSDRIMEQSADAFPAEERSSFQELKAQFTQVAVEIGSGSGRHLLEKAKNAPETLFVGFELRYKRAFRTIEKAETADISNVFMIRGDAQSINQLFSEEELSAVYIHFPDPWIKRRWRKHRLVQEGYINLLTSLLKEGGTLSFRTDHTEYFSAGFKALESTRQLKVTSYTTDLVGEDPENFVPSSEFESLFVSQGLKIGACTLVKISIN